jgi:uncharacterized damage-inducible protein DinB
MPAMAIRDAVLAEFDREMGITRRLLERIPDEQFGWKPHDKSTSLGGLATHLATLARWGGTIMTTVSFDLHDARSRNEPKSSRAEVLALFDDTTRTTRATLDTLDAEYQATWSLKRGSQEMFSLPRAAALRSLVVSHMIHHRGQLSVYLRLNNIPVPPVYGPSADEG